MQLGIISKVETIRGCRLVGVGSVLLDKHFPILGEHLLLRNDSDEDFSTDGLRQDVSPQQGIVMNFTVYRRESEKENHTTNKVRLRNSFRTYVRLFFIIESVWVIQTLSWLQYPALVIFRIIADIILPFLILWAAMKVSC